MRIVPILSNLPNQNKKFQTKIYAECLGSQSDELTYVAWTHTLLYPCIIKIKDPILVQNLQRADRQPMHNFLPIE